MLLNWVKLMLMSDVTVESEEKAEELRKLLYTYGSTWIICSFLVMAVEILSLALLREASFLLIMMSMMEADPLMLKMSSKMIVLSADIEPTFCFHSSKNSWKMTSISLPRFLSYRR